MCEIINWCNQNEGFLAAVLSVLTILISVMTMIMTYRLGKMPYKRKLNIIPFLHKEEDEYFVELLIVNNGFATINIRTIHIENMNHLVIGMAEIKSELIILKPNEYIKQKVKIFDDLENISEHELDLNNHVVIKVWDVDGKVYKRSKGFPVG